MSEGAPGSADQSFAHWLVHEGRDIHDPSELMNRACNRARDLGLPVDRIVAVGFLVHPLIHGVSYEWQPEKGVTATFHPHGLQHVPAFRNSPVAAVVASRQSRRHRLEGSDSEYEAEVYRDLRAAGFTDYVALPVPFRSSDRVHALTVATRQPGGFSDSELLAIGEYAVLFGLIFEIEIQRWLARTVLRTYLGKDAGSRVGRGQVKRGDSQTIEACIFMCDLRGFTKISDTAPMNEVLQLLDEYFEVVVGAVELHGGEVLKFIGDAVLAVFRVGDGASASEACHRAVEASRAALVRAQEFNKARASIGRRPMDFGIALHYGQVLYGNIGSLSRLDFTVIGPAVNAVSRIADLCSPLGESVLISSQVVEHLGAPLESAGRHLVKGIDAPIELFKLTAGGENRPES